VNRHTHPTPGSIAPAAGRWWAALVAAPLSARGLALGFLGLAAFLTVSGWLRPPLSTDLRSQAISLGWWSGGQDETLLHGARPVVPDSIGVALLGVIALLTVVVLARPQRLGLAAGGLLAVALAGNAVAAFNHPLLVQALDYEFEQRQQMSQALATVAENAMPNPTNGRVGLLGLPTSDEQPGDLERGVLYLLYGRWLVLWAALGVLCGVPGRLSRRCGVLGVSVLAGLVLAAAACYPRLHGEYHWLQARRLESEGRLAEARQHLERAVAAFPAFAQLERTWLLTGKLDHCAGLHTGAQRFFAAYQLQRDKLRPRARTFHQDLPWVIPAARDYRMGLASPPSTFNMIIAIGDGKSGTPSFRQSWSAAPPALTAQDGTQPRSIGGEQAEAERAYRHARAQAPRVALDVLDELLATTDEAAAPVVRRQMARIWAGVALAQFLRPSAADQGGRYYWRDGTLSAAQLGWQRAGAYDPQRRDSAYFLGLTQARLAAGQPETTAAPLAAAQHGLADHILGAEMLTVLGDAYFEAGEFELARQCYARSFDMFCLPKVINTRAQERLGGR